MQSANTARAFFGIDVGSTTVKSVVLNEAEQVVHSEYRRHLSEVRKSVGQLIRNAIESLPGYDAWHVSLTGSGAIDLAGELNMPFVQEVMASSLSIRHRYPDADVVIELGGEDAKLTYLTGGLDQRMNETCAGGTGAFIDQMAAFVQSDAAGLNELALNHKTIYPIASRCGVFAKTDILPLINEGCAKEDIAASIMQAVVNQTISGLARGRSIKGKVVFLGGPLAFLSSLRQRFVSTLRLKPEQAIFPDKAEFFVALGAALFARRHPAQSRPVGEHIAMLNEPSGAAGADRLPPLFAGAGEYDEFLKRHANEKIERLPLENARGDAWLGFDSGSTTIKAALVDAKGRLLYSSYGPNKGDPLPAAIAIMKEIYAKKRPDLHIRAAAATGYGSALIKAALCADIDEVETVAHFKAAQFFEPKVTFVLDIGGQDIKCMHIYNRTIDRIQLNEACSAGCGSFIENFATSLQIALPDFVEASLKAKRPVDLGTRCTVFMNSKVKQAQKEGAELGDIAAGLSYAVVRNACYKVIRITNTEDLGAHVVAQGGAFANDALLRALELELGRPVIRPDIAGLMGAFGAALIARERGPADGETKLISPEELEKFRARVATARCGKCTNNCLLTITTFADKRRFISGNRCERGADTIPQKLPNLYEYKYKRLFEPYTPLPPDRARRGVVGIPRCLNMYENYPLWFTFFTALGFRVELSAHSSKQLFFQGYETIPSQTVCYPAKLAHGHILDLISRGVKRIFFPCVPREQIDFDTQEDHYNCPVVIGYPELLGNNITDIQDGKVTLYRPFVPLDEEMLGRRLRDVPLFADIPASALEEAVKRGFQELNRYKADVRSAGKRALEDLSKTGGFGVVLAGHPYHVDPGVHHGIAQLVTSCGMAVLTEDSVAHLHDDPGKLRVVDQWTYHARLYRAGAFAAGKDNLAVLQLVSFGCGLDAITSDQLEEIVTVHGRLYAQIKIDEGANLGPARIRIRSLLAAMREHRANAHQLTDLRKAYAGTPVFTEEMRKTHTILIPQMSPIHFQFTESIFANEGYKVAQLPIVDRKAIDLGLRYVNNDACFPAIVVVGQLLQAISDGRYDSNRVALLISQTGGGCRATNYVAFLRKALSDCGMQHIPIITFHVKEGSESPGFKLTFRMIYKVMLAGLFGDALMRVLHRVSPYELKPGSAAKLAEEWAERGKKCIASGNVFKFDYTMFAMIRAFDRLPLRDIPRKPRVGVVGEILLKYHPDANNNVTRLIEEEGGEVVVPDLMDFVLYSLYDHVFRYKHLTGSWKASLAGWGSIKFLEFSRWAMRLGFRLSKRFTAPVRFKSLRKMASTLISLGHQTGEGWLLPAEMMELLESGVSNILCLQPFGCLPNHITGKGLMKELKRRFPEANIVAVDYDPGASEVNQVNRIKLMMSAAK